MYAAVENMQETQHVVGDLRGDSSANISVKVPKRVLHFSDGTLEEYSDDEVDSTPKNEEKAVVDPKSLTWGPWFAYKAWRAGTSTLAAFDYMGEALAWFFGITSPKYYFEIEEYKRLEAKKKAEEEKRKGWSEPSEAAQSVPLGEITEQPTKKNSDARD